MSNSATFAPKILSGIDVVDQAWGGLFKGGRYLAYGTNASGRSLLTTSYIAAGTKSLDTSLLVSRLRQADLAIQAASLAFNLAEAIQSGLLRVSRTPFELELVERDDDSLESSLKALASLIVDASADRVIVDDFSPFTRFSSFDRFRTAFARLMTELEHAPSTLLVGMPEPANDASRRIVEYVGTLMTGALHLHVGCVDGFSQRTISLIPQIGHVTRRLDLCWTIDHQVAAVDELARPLDSIREAQPTASTGRPAIEETPDYEPPARAEAVAGTSEEDTADEIAHKSVEDESTSFEFSVEPAPDLGASEEMVFLDRDRFTDELQLYFDDFETAETPFTLVAMRSEEPKDGSGSDDFHSIIAALQGVLGREDSLFADAVVERIIVILGDGDPDGAQQLFTRLRSYLRESNPERADHLLNVVAAVVVPNGKPFSTAEEFAQYVLDEGQ